MNGNFYGQVKRGGTLTAWPLELHLGKQNIAGKLTANGKTLSFQLVRPSYKESKPAPQAGTYTLALPHPADPSLPQGDGCPKD